MPKNTQRLTDNTYHVPFGRYSASGEVPSPATEVFIGREGHRAFLIELLVTIGRRGAFLVTGRRGAGKSSFVKHCLDEYEGAVLTRFLRSNSGRGPLDYFLVLLAGIVLLIGALLLSELLQVLLPPEGSHKPLPWLALIPVCAILLYPLVYASRAFEALDPLRLRRSSPFIFSLLFVLTVVLCWLFVPRLEPGSIIIVLVAFLSALYFAGQVGPLGPPPAFIASILTALLFSSLPFSQISQDPQASAAPTCLLLGLGLLLRGIHLYLATPRHSTDELAQNRAMRSSTWPYLLLGLALLAAFFQLSAQTTPSEPMAAFYLVATLLFTLGILLKYVAVSHQPSEVLLPTRAALLGAKAFFSIVAALQLAHPLLYQLQRLLLGSDSVSHLRPTLFTTRTDELTWLIAVLVALALFYFVEYEWIIRPGARFRELPILQGKTPLPGEDIALPQPTNSESIRLDRTYASLTLPWLVQRAWLPALTVSVNLGFDRLGHSQIIQAMLAGLRSRYYKIFLAWNSPLANLSRLTSVLFLFLLITFIGNTWFFLPSPQSFAGSVQHDRLFIIPQLERSANALQREWFAENDRLASQKLRYEYQRALKASEEAKALLQASVCTYLDHRSPGSVIGQPHANLKAGPAAKLICWAGEIWSRLLFFNLLPPVPASTSPQLLLNQFLPVAAPPSQPLPQNAFAASSQPVPAGLHFCVYHLLLLVLLAFIGRWIFRRLPLLPYHQNLGRIDDLLDSLSSRQKTTSSPELWGPARWVYSLLSDERVRELERDPVDPRTVEIAFLEILDDIQRGGIRFLGAARHHLSFPAPEVTFVFDELDKLGMRSEVKLPEPSSRSEVEGGGEAHHAERLRSAKLRDLLSELKNVLASAPARFVFVGGRNLYDEWLADQTARQPLLPSIFDAQVYLPSLLTDRPAAGSFSFDYRIRQFLSAQYERSHLLFKDWWAKLWVPHFALPNHGLHHNTFAFHEHSGDSLKLFPEPSKRTDFLPTLVRDFCHFLAYRSMGNPKTLRDLFLTFIRPVGRETPHFETSCRSVLRFDDVTIFRIQLLANVYCHLLSRFEPRLSAGDDKAVVSLFFLTDFLFKFHGRAFSWSNLERVDDLSHIHRLPNLRELQANLVDQFSERYLHRVLNGMYAFRFRSDEAAEIDYLSRISPEEMAAFNFTLDESQTLKALYTDLISGKQGRDPDFLAALGELHDFDHEFQHARHYYRLAIELVDQDMAATLDEKGEDREVISRLLRGERTEDLRSFMSWGVARLRLMLQTGMTFEQERNWERAATEYRNGRTLARSLVGSYLDSLGRGEPPPTRPELAKRARLHTLKELHLLFQPALAEAWLSEKVEGVIDSSTSLLERTIGVLRASLPVVRDSRSTYSSQHTPVHANFLLTISQLHNRVGDLYFFKGRGPTNKESIRKAAAQDTSRSDRSSEGFLLRAHFHYAAAIHELRRFMRFRVMTSDRLSLDGENRASRTFTKAAIPDFIYRALGGCLNDMAEATLARVSFVGLKANLLSKAAARDLEVSHHQLKSVILSWLICSDEVTVVHSLNNWLGGWIPGSDHSRNLVFEGRDPDDLRVLRSIKLALVGAELFFEGGYPEDAGREAIQICEAVTRYLWWRAMMKFLQTKDFGEGAWLGLENWSFKIGEQEGPFWQKLLDLGVTALHLAERSFERSRRSDDRFLVELMPSSAVTLLCSLGLVATELELSTTLLNNLAEHWQLERSYENCIKTALDRKRYPMVNRLHGLKVLIDSLALGKTLDMRSILNRTIELHEQNCRFNAPLHFTPLHSGISCALVWLVCRDGIPAGDRDLKRIKAVALDDLRVSEEMYTMRRSYYESISDLYYLYDDFNDRQIHFNHAIQMAGSELAAILRHLVENWNEKTRPPLPEPRWRLPQTSCGR